MIAYKKRVGKDKKGESPFLGPPLLEDVEY
jgi:hypothetical protein